MITAITGKTGSGKSYFGVWFLHLRLLRGTNHIVTTLPLGDPRSGRLGLDRLAAFMEREHPDWGGSVYDRITLIDDTEECTQLVRSFWRIRGHGPDYRIGGVKGLILAPPPYQVALADGVYEMRTKFEELGEAMVPVDYFLDEWHLVYSSKHYRKVADACTWYISQHRKLCDNVWWLTQVPRNVHDEFRSQTHEWLSLRNLSHERWWGWVAAPKRVRWVILPEEPLGAGDQGTGRAIVYQTRYTKMDLRPDGLANCYLTMKGSGVNVRTADGPESTTKKAGVPLAWVVALVVILVIAAAWGVPKGVGWVVGRSARAVLSSADVGMRSGVSAVVTERGLGGRQLPSPDQSAPVASVPSSVPARAVSAPATPALWVTGTVKLPDAGWIVYLSNGEELREGSQRLGAVGSGWAFVDGVRLSTMPRAGGVASDAGRAGRSGL